MIDDEGEPSRFADAVVELIRDDVRRESLATCGREMAKHINNEAMVEKFTIGILKSLNLPVSK
jgi:hypothetical protein